MSESLETLESYWRYAGNPVPLLILGGGRWARVWATVAAKARGSGRGIAIVGRSNIDDLELWSAMNADTGFAVGSDPLKALAQLRREGANVTAIVASRPRDHRRDIRFCLEHGVSALVEKPFVADPAEGFELLAAARERGVTLGLVIEFSLLPALHLIDARSLGPSGALHWAEPTGEERHGSVKRRHAEITALEDILPHAASIFDALWPSGSSISLSNIMPPDPNHAIWRLQMSRGDNLLALELDTAAPARSRLLSIERGAGGEGMRLDFAASPERLYSGREEITLPQRWRDLSSTLRLVLGAWFLTLANGAPQPRIVAGLASHVALHADLREKLEAMLPDHAWAK